MDKQTILIVDDESTNISILLEILHEEYNLLVAIDGFTALEIVNSDENIDLILLDIVMPEMNGYEVAQKLKQNHETSTIPFIFLTAKSDSQSMVKGFQEGAVDYISKPFSREELLARVHNHLQRYKLSVELSENKNFLQSVLQYSSHAIIVTDLNGTITLFNKAAEEMLGYASEELLGKKTPFLFDDIIQVQQRAKQFSKELGIDIEVGFDVFVIKSRYEMSNMHEWDFITKKNNKIVVNLSVSALRNSTKEIIGYMGIAEDISQKKIYEKKIARYVDIMDTNIISSSTDLNGIITDVSKAFCKLTGYSREEFIGKSHNILRHVDIEDSTYDLLWDTIKNNEIWNGEVKNVKKDGSLYWVNATIFPLLDNDDKKIGYMAIRQDITDKKAKEEQQIEIKKSQEKLQKLFDHQKNMIIISDGKQLKMANYSMCHFFGISKIEEFTKFYADISDKFIEMHNYFSVSKIPKGINWIEALEPLEDDCRVVAMHDLHNMPHAFSVAISKFEGDDFIVSLTDISSTMIEKIDLKNKVTHDKLTGALNREFLDNNFSHIVTKISDANHLGLAILDIDFFKKVNDNYGHIVGDTILKELTKLATSSIRKKDFFIRWGGEEFIVLIESESIQSLLRALEHLRQRVQYNTFSDIGKLICSFGATLYRVGENIDTTIQRADKALYKAKENGRNQVQIEE